MSACLYVLCVCTRYDNTAPQRNHVLLLLNVSVVLYLVSSLYIICLYGGFGGLVALASGCLCLKTSRCLVTPCCLP